MPGEITDTELRRRRQATQFVPEKTPRSTRHDLKDVPKRRRAGDANSRGGSASSPTSVLYSSFEQVPDHLKDNRFILRGYRANYDFKEVGCRRCCSLSLLFVVAVVRCRCPLIPTTDTHPPPQSTQALMSALRLHNETGNIWSHLIGFLIFALLTFATVSSRPSPLSIGSDFARAVESKFDLFDRLPGNSLSLYDIVSKAAAWEDRVVRYGGEQLHAIEDVLDVLKNITKNNIHSIDDGLSSLGRQFSNLRTNFSAMASTPLLQDLHHLESLVYESLTSLVDVTWPVHRWPIHVFTIGAMVCLLTSSICHLFGCCSKHVAMLMWQFDYAGIAVLIVASFFPPVYYGFLCHPLYVVTYLGIVSVCGMATIAITLMPTFQQPHYHAFRAATFSSLGLFGIIPTLHAWSLHRQVHEVNQALILDLWMGAIYLLGTGVYTLKVPERFWPGRFDVAFHSHQLFHIAVVVAAMVHYKACWIMVAWRDRDTGFCLR